MKFTLDYEKYADLARQAAAEGCVLLKNEKEALPIKAGETVSVFGRIQFTYYKSGTGSGGLVNVPYVVSILDGLKACSKIRINRELEEVYREWIRENPFDTGEGWAQEPWCQKEMPVSRELAQKAAKSSDLAVVILGRTAGEDRDNSAAEGSYLLTKEEEAMLEAVCSAFDRTVVVLNVGNIIDMKWVDRYQPQAVLYAWQGGMEGGNGVADVLTGAAAPSGRLSDTIAEDISDYPSAANFGDGDCNIYTEDIYVGYRYFETFAPQKVKYPFGFGLSYTEFAVDVTSLEVPSGLFVDAVGQAWPAICRGIEANADREEIGLKVCVTNTGKCAGKEVVQVYVCPPQGKLGKPVRNLIRFGKTTLLSPGEAEDMEFSFSIKEAASYDDGGVTGNKSCYVLEPGTYGIYVGTDVRSAKLCGSVLVEELTVTQKCREALAPVREFKRLRPETAAVDVSACAVDGMESAGGKLSSDRKASARGEAAVQPPFAEGWEPVPTRTVDLARRILEERPDDAVYTGDRGYKLSDVCDKKVTVEEFLAQLSDDDLICMSRGEGMCSPKVTPGTAGAFGGVTDSLKAFGIPVACCADGPSGIRMDCGTNAFSMPNGTALACTFNVHLVEELYEMEGRELRKNRIDTLLGPGINIHRSPLNGRNFEYFSEDPYLTGKMAAAQLAGMGKYGVTGTIKHFACNNQEFRRSFADSVLSERAAREIDLRPFEIAVKEGKAYSIMSSYNPVNGLWAAGNYDLMTTILREEWGYQGIVMTDWWAKMNDEGEEGTKQNTVAMVRAQNDIYMVVADAAANSSEDNTAAGLLKGALTRGQLVRNAANICTFLMKSPVMNRFLDREFDVCDVLNDFSDKKEQDNILQIVEAKDGCCLDISALQTKKGTSASYVLNFAEQGKYTILFRLKAKAGVNPLAQMPVSVFFNNQLARTISVSGVENEWVEREVECGVFVTLQNYMKLFFGESGLEIGEIRIRKENIQQQAQPL